MKLNPHQQTTVALVFVGSCVFALAAAMLLLALRPNAWESFSADMRQNASTPSNRPQTASDALLELGRAVSVGSAAEDVERRLEAIQAAHPDDFLIEGSERVNDWSRSLYVFSRTHCGHFVFEAESLVAWDVSYSPSAELHFLPPDPVNYEIRNLRVR